MDDSERRPAARDPQARPAEFIEVDGDVWSWYCATCCRELGADLSVRDGCPPGGCPEHGRDDLAWETWATEADPSYPHLST